MTTRGNVHHARIDSRALRDNPLGDPATRDLYVYLPPSYDRDTARRFPVVYMLTGFGSRGRAALNDNGFSPNIAERMDKLISRGDAREMIVCLPDCFTRLGGSQYINSTATGRYADHFTDEVVSFVDAGFRTVPAREARAVVGRSSGGYGALVQIMRRPDLFSIAAAHAADALFEYSLLPDFPRAFRTLRRKADGDPRRFVEAFHREERKSGDDFLTMNVVAMSACYSPDEENPPSFHLPFDAETGELRPDVWARWLEHDPVRMIERSADYRDALRSARLLFLDAGTRDEHALDLGARAFAARLRAHDIRHTHEEFDDGHRNTSYRYDRSLALIAERMKAEG